MDRDLTQNAPSEKPEFPSLTRKRTGGRVGVFTSGVESREEQGFVRSVGSRREEEHPCQRLSTNWTAFLCPVDPRIQSGTGNRSHGTKPRLIACAAGADPANGGSQAFPVRYVLRIRKRAVGLGRSGREQHRLETPRENWRREFRGFGRELN